MLRYSSRQGALDGLCGIYSIINSVALISPKGMGDEDRSTQFMSLVNLLDDGRSIGEIIHEGIGFRKLGELIDVCSRRRRRSTGVDVHRRVAMKQDPKSFSEFWELLQEHVDVDRKQTAILGMSGKYDHWTVVKTISEKRIELQDSDGLHYLNRAQCGLEETEKIRHILWPTQTYLLSSVPFDEVLDG
ncbi:hypothetical protein [Flexibacterium corallicola]|uniref:hypothetical protein n=1 Tax=Flexibacterium corallicola TaxID=3037259 RepID=UPI00286EB4E0|nr:hypothetical protein [Pseudovibrio sp. M1P-2-3]